MEPKIGIIGGSGLYRMPFLTGARPVSVRTPFGAPSDDFVVGAVSGVTVAFLPRHGRGHRISPSELNHAANIHGFKQLGVERILSVTAVGSLTDRIRPLDIVIPDQFYDRTHSRTSTFFGDGLVAHVSFADPVCPEVSRILYDSARTAGATAHLGGTLVCIEGPAFSTRSETEAYRRLGMDIVGMTTLQEAKLAREAEICYGAVALVTDGDCLETTHDPVKVATVLENLDRSLATASRILEAAVQRLPARLDCPCAVALKGAIMTEPSAVPERTRKKLALLVDKYLMVS